MMTSSAHLNKNERVITFLKENVDFFSAPFLKSEDFQTWAKQHKDEKEFRSLSDDMKYSLAEKIPAFADAICGKALDPDDRKNALIGGNDKRIRTFLERNPRVTTMFLRHIKDSIIQQWKLENNLGGLEIMQRSLEDKIARNDNGDGLEKLASANGEFISAIREQSGKNASELPFLSKAVELTSGLMISSLPKNLQQYQKFSQEAKNSSSIVRKIIGGIMIALGLAVATLGVLSIVGTFGLASPVGAIDIMTGAALTIAGGTLLFANPTSEKDFKKTAKKSSNPKGMNNR